MSDAASNVSPAELRKFGALAARWWDPAGPQAPLHHLNPARLAYVVAHAPLVGRRVLDVGCGGGLLSEAMAGLGAQVTGLDLAPELIEVANLHRLERQAAGDELGLDYRMQSVESLAAELPGGFHVITCMEMLEHVPDPGSVLRACHDLLAPGGVLLLSTLNRTLAAFAGAIVGAEYLAGLLPRGTHDWRQFIKPAELAAGLREAGLDLLDVSGLAYNPLTRQAKVGGPPTVNYLCCARKPLV